MICGRVPRIIFIPEPSTIFLVGLGIIGLIGIGRRARRLKG